VFRKVGPFAARYCWCWVEESAAAAQSLRDQSLRLSGAVSRFRYTGEVVTA
jgi:hypothetical protein